MASLFSAVIVKTNPLFSLKSATKTRFAGWRVMCCVTERYPTTTLPPFILSYIFLFILIHLSFYIYTSSLQSELIVKTNSLLLL